MRHSKTAMTIAVMTLSLAACAGKQNDQAGSQAQRNEDEKALYALGAMLASNITSFELTAEELKHVQAGFADGALQKDVGDLRAYVPQLEKLHSTRAAAAAEREKKAGEAYLAKAAAEEGAQKTESGIVYKEITPGTGPSPKQTDVVKVHYHGTLQNGKVFDSSIERNEPAVFPLAGVIPCWTEGVQLMKIGGKSRLVCPAETAYGERGAPPHIMPGATLIFEVELLGIEG
jgi:FKBP-type peptidyl-prolyl cis-trans isomerase FkpA